MLRFRCSRSLQRFFAVHSAFFDPFNQNRGLSTREHFRQNRTAARAGWRGLCSA